MAQDQASEGGGTNGAATSLESIRAATLAALEANEHVASKTEEPAPAKKPAKVTEETDEETDDTADESSEDEDEREESDADEGDDEDEDLEDDTDDEEDEDADEETGTKDPDLAKRLDKVRKAERRAKDLIAKERQTFEEEREKFIAEWKPRIEAAAKFEKLQARVKYNFIETLAELGVNVEDDGEDLARELYAHSKKGSADPNNKAATAQARKYREMLDEVRDLKRWKEEREQTEAQREAAAREEAKAQAFLGSVTKKIGDEQPLLKRLLTANEQRATAIVAQATLDLLNELGEQPSRKRVLLRAEKMTRREFKSMGVDLSALGVKASTAAPTTTKKKPTAPVKKSDGTKPKTLEEHRAETLRRIQSGDLD